MIFMCYVCTPQASVQELIRGTFTSFANKYYQLTLSKTSPPDAAALAKVDHGHIAHGPSTVSHVVCCACIAIQLLGISRPPAQPGPALGRRCDGRCFTAEAAAARHRDLQRAGMINTSGDIVARLRPSSSLEQSCIPLIVQPKVNALTANLRDAKLHWRFELMSANFLELVLRDDVGVVTFDLDWCGCTMSRRVCASRLLTNAFARWLLFGCAPGSTAL